MNTQKMSNSLRSSSVYVLDICICWRLHKRGPMFDSARFESEFLSLALLLRGVRLPCM